MTGAWGLPMQAELGGVRYAIRSDYRDVLELLRWLNGQADPALDQSERWYVAMRLFYPEFAALPQSLWPDATQFLTEFLAAGRREQPRKTAELCDAHSAGAVGRRDRHRRAAQHIKRHVTEELIGLLVIAAQDALRNAVRVALRGRADRHRQQVRLGDLLGLDRAADRADVVGDALAHHVALKECRERLRHRRGGVEVCIDRAAVAHGDHKRRLRLVHGAVEQRGGNVAAGGDRGGKHQDQPELAPQLPRDQQQRNVFRLRGGLRFLFVHRSTASHSTTTICRV